MGFLGWTIDGLDPAAIHASVAVEGWPRRRWADAHPRRQCGVARPPPTTCLEPHPERRKATSTRRCWTIGKPKTLSRTVRCSLNSASMKTTCTPWRLRKPPPLSRPLRRSMPCLGLAWHRYGRRDEPPRCGTHASHLHRLNGVDLMQALRQPAGRRKRAGPRRTRRVITLERFNKPWPTWPIERAATRSSSVKTWRSLEPSVSTWASNVSTRCSSTCPVRGKVIIHTVVGAALSGMRPMVEISLGLCGAGAQRAGQQRRRCAGVGVPIVR